MRRNGIDRISHRWLLAFALVGLFAMAEGSYALAALNADDACLHQCLGDPDCGGLTFCDTALPASACCTWDARIPLPVAELKPAPNTRQQECPTPFALDSKSLSSLLALSYHTDFSPDKAHLVGAGTETYLATARLRI